MITGTPDPLNTIVKLVFDASVEDIAYSLPSNGSLTKGQKSSVKTEADGNSIAAVTFDNEKTFDRFEFTIENPGYLRGEGKPFELQVKNSDENWKTVYKGQVFGTIVSKRIDPVSAKNVRIVVQANAIKQFDIFL
jgi:hypothetical protein